MAACMTFISHASEESFNHSQIMVKTPDLLLTDAFWVE